MQLTFTGERYVPEIRGQIAYEHLHRYALVVPFAQGRDVLDIACGEGYGSALLARDAASVNGVDLDELTILHAGARYPAMNLTFRVGSVTDIPFADASFDLVVSFETLEHLAEQERMLAEVSRVLRPGGRLVISSPNRLIYSDARNYSNPYHVRELYFHEFRNLLRQFFPSVRIYGQRIFGASIVHPLSGHAEGTTWHGTSRDAQRGLPALPESDYFIAVCARDEVDQVDISSVFVDPGDDLLNDIRRGGLMAGGTQQSLSGESSLRAIESGRLDDDQVNAYEAELSRMRDDVAQVQARYKEQLALVTGERDSTRTTYEAEIERLNAESERLRRSHATQLQDLRDEADHIRSQRERDLLAQRADYEQAVARLESQLADTRAAFEGMRSAARDGEASLKETREAYESEFKRSRESYDAEMKRLRDADEAELKRTREAADAAITETRVAYEAELKRAREELDAARSRYEAVIAGLEADLGIAQHELESAVNAVRDSYEAELTALRDETAEVRATYESMLEQRSVEVESALKLERDHFSAELERELDRAKKAERRVIEGEARRVALEQRVVRLTTDLAQLQSLHESAARELEVRMRWATLLTARLATADTVIAAGNTARREFESAARVAASRIESVQAERDRVAADRERLVLEVASVTDERQRLVEERDAAARECDRLHAVVSELQHSVSWRMTEPGRRLASLVRRRP